MTRIHDGERGFKDHFLEGLTAAYPRYLRQVPGASAVMAVDSPVPGQVSVIIGGGSGHYPAFAGLVGPGLCHGAVVGDVFTSPSATQAYRAIEALDGGAGVILAFGNYSGDVMHFGLAAEQARAAGIDARIVLATDDVASRPAAEAAQRRGIAGGFFVFRAASAAARRGDDIDTVERLARHANDRTRTFGIALAGCTFPGRDEPLFTIDRDTIALGLGIHGEPGIETMAWVPARELAPVLLEPLLRERPAGARRARVLLNGLGSTKYEELFVLYRSVHERLLAAGVEPVEVEVGEFVTSLDMAGCSLTLCWLDDALEDLLATPAAAPGYRSGTLGAPIATRHDRPSAPPRGVPAAATLTTTVTPGARAVRDVLTAIAADIRDATDELGRLDAAVGDGDHGVGMARGIDAAVAAVGTSPTASGALAAAGAAFGDAAGGASGALWGAGLLAMARVIGERVPPDGCPGVGDVRAALAEALAVVRRLGGADVGDRTLVDVLVPFVDAFPEAGASLASAWEAALPAARAAVDATAGLVPRKGRAAVHGTHALGTVDAGARSLGIALEAAGRALRAGAIGEEGAMSGDADRLVIVVGADGLGRPLLDVLVADLRADPRVRDVIDLGVPSTDDPTAYPHVGIAVAETVARGEADRALLVCGTGIGMAISANKVRGVRAAVAHDPYSLERSVRSNDCQVLCMGANVVAPALARSLLSSWLGHRFDPASPSGAKVAVIRAYEAQPPDEGPPAE